MKISTITAGLLDQLTAQAELSPRRRQHRNGHRSYEDPCQRVFNAVGVDSYIRPHRHLADPKHECLLALRGLMTFVTFYDDGEIDDVVRFGAAPYSSSDELSVGVEIPPGVWHTVIADVPGSILFEVKAGPFDPSLAKEFAEWAPPEGGADGRAYLNELRRRVAGG